MGEKRDLPRGQALAERRKVRNHMFGDLRLFR